ncbi:hypothetical protein [Nocardioides sp. InS609-2]|uniref:hypothetical protein n=1 Tax=Nocardioides sp. InS609-2 TaxID=2760705 RepID=UPI0020BE031D|nr:hypothetical protein [Nocardioides sp. InS609-2]
MNEKASGRDPADPRTDLRVRSSARHAIAVTSLLERHPTMRGVSRLADQVDESVRWAV